MKKYIVPFAAVLAVGLIAGCGGGGGGSSSTTAISGSVADGYLAGATVFMDKNGNYQLDAGEPSTATDAQGAYFMTVDPADVGKYPLVAMAIKGQTIDKDTNQTVAANYLLSMPAAAVSGRAHSNFISPMSTLISEVMAANPGISLHDAMTQLRNQLNLPVGIDMMADYIAGSRTGTDAVQYQRIHTTSQQLVGLMTAQAALVMNGTGVNQNRYHAMMATINSNMPAIAANVMNGQGVDSPFMTGMMNQMQTQLSGVQTGGGFANYSGMFSNMTSHRHFWTADGTPLTPMGGGMMR